LVVPYRGAEPLQLQLMATGITSSSALGKLLKDLQADVGACLSAVKLKMLARVWVAEEHE